MTTGRRTAVVVRGSGDVGSAVAHLLHGSGFGVAIHDVGRPAAPRRGMAFTDAVFDGTCELAGLRARRVDDLAALDAALDPARGAAGEVPVTTADLDALLAAVRPEVLVDARMRKRARPEVQRHLAPLTIGLGPNFVVGETTDLAIETIWGDDLGAVVSAGATRRLAGEPRSFDGHARDRFVYAPAAGLLRTEAAIGQLVRAGDPVAAIGELELRAPLDGILRGLTHDGVEVEAGAKVVEVDPRGEAGSVFGIGERPRRIARGVLAAIRTRESRGEPPSSGG
jgi:xanthine dehydrogenase accessory factor